MSTNDNRSKEDLNSQEETVQMPDTGEDVPASEEIPEEGDPVSESSPEDDRSKADSTDHVPDTDGEAAPPEKKPKVKKNWRSRSIPERLVALIPTVIMLGVMLTAVWQMEPDAPYPPKAFFSLAIVLAAMVIGIFCVRLGKVWGWIVTALTPAASFLLTEYFTHNPFDIKQGIVCANLVLYYGAALLVLFLTGSMKASVAITAGVPMVFGIANYYTLELRGTPLFPWDIASAGIAADVVDNYKFEVSWHVCFIVCAFLFIILLGFLSTPRIRLKWWWLRAPIAAVSAAAIVLTGSYVQSDKGVKELGMYPYLFTPKTVYNRNGAAVTFAYTLQFATIQKPEGYSPENLSEMLSEYESEPVTEDTVLPNVIVIMNEAFSDLKTAAEYKENREITPYINALTEDTVKGTAHVSVKGGNTANSEFEFLTGLSMAHFAPGSIPYQQYLKGETPSLASQLAELGYSATAIHPYGATGWNRDSVYEWFGFEDFLSSADFKGCEKIRSYYSDAATYDKIIELYESKDEGEPMFVFDVTMQNHGGYTSKSDNFKITEIYAAGMPLTGVTNTYLALMNKSDEAFGGLVEYFKAQDEPTVILMFGDHQPNDNVVKPLWKVSGETVETGTLEEQLRRYTVPFVMWANYDIEEAEYVDTSLNFLSSMLCETAGIPRTAAQMYLSDLAESYPVITAGHYGDISGNYYDAIAMENVKVISDYSKLSYNVVSDRKNTLLELFSYN